MMDGMVLLKLQQHKNVLKITYSLSFMLISACCLLCLQPLKLRAQTAEKVKTSTVLEKKTPADAQNSQNQQSDTAAPETTVVEPIKVFFKSRESKAKDAVIGYYTALIATKFDKAAALAHPNLIKKMHYEIEEELENTSKESMKRTLELLNVSSIEEFKNLENREFFVLFANSVYGRSLKRLSSEKLGVQVGTQEIRCSKEPPFICEVHVELTMTKQKNKVYRFVLWAEEHALHYVVGRTLSDFESDKFLKEMQKLSSKKIK